MSRTMRVILTGILALGALVAGGVAFAADPAPAAPSRVTEVEQDRRPAQQVPDGDCPDEAADGAVATIRM